MDCGKGKFDLLAIKNRQPSFFDFRTPSPLKLTLKFCYILFSSKKWHFSLLCDVISRAPYTIVI